MTEDAAAVAASGLPVQPPCGENRSSVLRFHREYFQQLPGSDLSMERQHPSFFLNSLILVGIMFLYPLVGALFLPLVTGGRMPDALLLQHDRGVVNALRIAQAAGQILVLALPVFWISRRFSGSPGLFAPANLRYLGIVRPDDTPALLQAAAGMLLLQPALHTVVETQGLLLPLLGKAGREIMLGHERLELFVRTLAGSGTVAEFLAVAVVFAVVPACCEELFFRGFIQRNYTVSLGPAGAVLFTGFVFALFHMDIANLLPLTLLGWYIGYIYRRTGVLAAPAAVHATNNLAALLFLFGEERLTAGTAFPDGYALLLEWQWWLFVLATLGLFVRLMVRFSRRTVRTEDQITVDRHGSP